MIPECNPQISLVLKIGRVFKDLVFQSPIRRPKCDVSALAAESNLHTTSASCECYVLVPGTLEHAWHTSHHDLYRYVHGIIHNQTAMIQ